MKAIQIKQPYTISCVDIPTPIVKSGEARIRIVSAGICGSDINTYRGTNGLVTYPRIIGHELAGVVEQLPEDSPNGLHVGDRVVVNPYLYCGHCYPCSIHRTNCCNNLKCLGVHVDGGMGEYFSHPADMLLPLPDSISWDIAPILEPLVIALHGLRRGGLSKGEYVAIIGAGPIGLLAALAAKAFGATPILLDIIDQRLEYARACGIDNTVNSQAKNAVQAVSEITHGNMAHLVCECSGSNLAIRSSLDLVCSAGRITLTGWPVKETSLPTDLFTKKELDVRGARTGCSEEFKLAIQLVDEGHVDLRKVLSKTISIEEAPEIIRDIAKNPSNYMKVNVML